ncbi:MAG TPA: GC-type dockerin domain-anchored protein [Phycisphaerales bacterium]|nr:GC-type dockerin domain-anchored protein [Phycisphaerales bacterium]
MNRSKMSMSLSSLGKSIVIAAVAASAGTAHGQCSVYRAGIPDFDQKRTTLPNDGKMYCVPTSWVNQMAFLQNNGYQGLMWPLYGTYNWQSQSYYPIVSSRIADMGNRMDTDPYDGTSLDWGDVFDYVNDFAAPNPYMIGIKKSAYPGGSSIGPTPKYAAAQLKLGGLVNMHIGWFKREGGQYKRTGGHSVTMNGAYNLCSGTPVMRWRDPSSGDSYSSQSTFSTSSSNAVPKFDVFRWGNDAMYAFIYQLDAYTGTTKGFMTGIVTLMVNFGVGIETGRDASPLTLVRPFGYSREELPSEEPIKFADAQDIVQLELMPEMTRALAVVGGKNPRVWMLDLAFGEHKPFFELDAVGPLALGRFEEIFVGQGSKVLKINPETGKPDAQFDGQNPIALLAYDDATDEVVAFDPLKRRLIQLDRNLRVLHDRLIPDGVKVDATSAVAIDPVGHNIWLAPGDGSVFEITRPREGSPMAKKHTLKGVDQIRSIQFLPDGGLAILCDGSVREFRRDEKGELVHKAISGFDGMKFNGIFRLAQSRDDTPAAFKNVIEPTVEPPAEGPENVPDCEADYDGSGFVDTDDFTAFVMDFEQGLLRSDVDYTGFVDTDDFTAFVTAFEKGC